MTLYTKWTEDDLGDDGTDFARRCRKAVRCRAIPGREAFARNDERSGVWSEVEEELAENVEGKKCVAAELVIGETDDNAAKIISHLLSRV